MSIKRPIKKTAILLLVFVCLSAATPEVFAQSVVIDAGMSPNQTVWAFDQDVRDANKKVTFWFRVQKQSMYNYYFKIEVFRPDGSEVCNVNYKFDKEGYAGQTLFFPIFFYDYSNPGGSSPSFGTWKVRTAVVDRNSQGEVSVKEYSFAFNDGKKQSPAQEVSTSGKSSPPLPVSSFQYKQWSLKGWGIGIYDEVSTGSNTYDKEIRVLESRNTFSVKEVADAWGKGHNFGAFLTGPPVASYVNSNNMPLYVFGYILKRPGGESDGQNPQSRASKYCNNPGSVIFPFDARKPGQYRIEFLLRERDSNYWEASSWVPIGGIDFTLTP